MKYYKRGFLNPEEGVAAFEAEVSVDTYEGQTHFYSNNNFSITDCSRKVALDFDFSDSEDYHNVMTKLETLQAGLEDFRIAMIEAFVEMKEFEGNKPDAE